MASQGLKAADEPSWRGFVQNFPAQRAASKPLCLKTSQTFPSIVISRTKAPLKGRLLVPKAIVYVCFCVIRAVARILPLHLPDGLERRRFWGGVSALEGHLPVLEGLRGAFGLESFWARELFVALKRSVAALGRPLA